MRTGIQILEPHKPQCGSGSKEAKNRPERKMCFIPIRIQEDFHNADPWGMRIRINITAPNLFSTCNSTVSANILYITLIKSLYSICIQLVNVNYWYPASMHSRHFVNSTLCNMHNTFLNSLHWRWFRISGCFFYIMLRTINRTSFLTTHTVNNW